jgi:DNA-binding SARP family transcriptional activator
VGAVESVDPEAPAREKMRALAAAGDLAGAIGEYARLGHELRAQYGVEPSRETKRLLDELRRDALPPLGKPH